MDTTDGAFELLATQHHHLDELIGELFGCTDAAHRSRVVIELADALTLHLAAEQELLYPALAGVLPAEVERELVAEHVEIKRVLADLLWLEPDDARFGPKLVALRDLVGLHEAWQEGELFPRVAAEVAPAVVAELSAHLVTWFDETVAVAA